MPRRIPQDELNAVLEAAARFPEGASVEEIDGVLKEKLPRRTLQRRLAWLVKQGRLIIEGRGRGSRYRLQTTITLHTEPAHIVLRGQEARLEVYIPISPEGKTVKEAVRLPVQDHRPVGYNRAFLDAYRPNDTFYLPEETRQRLLEMGRSSEAERPAGTYVRQIFNRLLIDLSWNSSRLEGNTYSLLETERLLELGESA